MSLEGDKYCIKNTIEEMFQTAEQKDKEVENMRQNCYKIDQESPSFQSRGPPEKESKKKGQEIMKKEKKISQTEAYGPLDLKGPLTAQLNELKKDPHQRKL